jgi:nucleoside-diphosphate-sugar epimerase
MILITGSEGLVGRHVSAVLSARQQPFRTFDLRRNALQDVRNFETLAAALLGITGVIHLAAVSRVEWAQRDPDTCKAVNVDALRELLRLCLKCPNPPWLIFVSSREVYGSQRSLPVSEDAQPQPINVYGRSKAEGERLVLEATAAGLVANICRLSNVFGCPLDHADRVAMAFAIAAAHGGAMRVDGGANIFDFTDVRDVADGIVRLADLTAREGIMPKVHFVSGVGTSLRELAQIAAVSADSPVTILEAAPRTYDVGTFVGNPDRAVHRLNWRASTPVRASMARLVADLKRSRLQTVGNDIALDP